LEWIWALVLTSAISRASEPAIATLPPPAPAVESVTNECLPSEPPEFRITAASSSPLDAIRVSSPTVASFVTLTRLIATAAPMLAVVAFVALPSALAVESVSAEVLNFAEPVVVRFRSSASLAIDFEVMIAIAAAAATVTVVPPFSPLFASGVEDEPELWPPLFVDALLPVPRFSFAFWFVLWPELSVSSSPEPDLPSAPAELAIACVSFEDEPSAVKLTLPPAVRFRFSCESTRWLETARPSERPMPALAPLVAPFAFVVALAVCVA
jgi:hypothetical protein